MYQYFTLNNGIRIVFRQNHSSVVHAGVYINVGSRDEQGANEGIAHFIEHSLFKGTTHRRSWHILNRIDGVGGELNAFTTKEETCLYASALAHHLGRCLELFADILFCSTFPEHEINHEKDVVIEEINSYKDSPSDQIFDDFEALFFADHPLAHNILGSRKNVRAFSSSSLHRFYSQHYTTDRMVISIVGNMDFKRVVYLCQKYFDDYPATASHSNRYAPQCFNPFHKTLNRHTHQVHALLGCPAYNLFDERKVAFTLLNNIIGGPAMNSRLNMAIREKYGFCYSVESQYTPFSDSGIFYIYSGIESDAVDRYFDLVHMTLETLRKTPLSTLQLHAAKQQLVGQMFINNELALNEMQSIGKSCLSFDHVDSLEEMQRDIENLTASDILDVANELFDKNKFSYLIYK